jgi:FHS family L-fucose permease-like MFS transporter
VQGKVIDATSPAFSFIVPAACYAVVMAYALYDLRATEPFRIGAAEPVPAYT